MLLRYCCQTWITRMGATGISRPRSSMAFSRSCSPIDDDPLQVQRLQHILRGSTGTNYFKFSLPGLQQWYYKFRVPMSLASSTCQYVLRLRRGLAQASPGLAQASLSLKAPRLQAFEARDLLHQHNRKGQVVMIKTRRSKRLVFGFVFCTLN